MTLMIQCCLAIFSPVTDKYLVNLTLIKSRLPLESLPSSSSFFFHDNDNDDDDCDGDYFMSGFYPNTQILIYTKNKCNRSLL